MYESKRALPSTFGLLELGSLHTRGADRLVRLVVRHPPRERKVPDSNPACAGIFSGSSHTSDFKIDTPVATPPGAWRYRVSTGTGRPGVSILSATSISVWQHVKLSVQLRP